MTGLDDDDGHALEGAIFIGAAAGSAEGSAEGEGSRCCYPARGGGEEAGTKGPRMSAQHWMVLGIVDMPCRRSRFGSGHGVGVLTETP